MIKRVFDISLSSFFLILCLPIISIITIIVLIKMGRPIIFSQVRPGKNGTPFRIYKFRTMRDYYDGKGRLLEDELRLTKFGSFLRSTSCDELPTLWNVLNGDMSLVGPRPLLMEYLPLYNKKQAKRHDIKPGLTGWAQVNGRNAISWKEKFDLDLWYIDHQSFWLDVKILLITIKKVLLRESITERLGVTMTKFNGNKE